MPIVYVHEGITHMHDIDSDYYTTTCITTVVLSGTIITAAVCALYWQYTVRLEQRALLGEPIEQRAQILQTGAESYPLQFTPDIACIQKTQCCSDSVLCSATW